MGHGRPPKGQSYLFSKSCPLDPAGFTQEFPQPAEFLAGSYNDTKMA